VLKQTQIIPSIVPFAFAYELGPSGLPLQNCPIALHPRRPPVNTLPDFFLAFLPESKPAGAKEALLFPRFPVFFTLLFSFLPIVFFEQKNGSVVFGWRLNFLSCPFVHPFFLPFFLETKLVEFCQSLFDVTSLFLIFHDPLLRASLFKNVNPFRDFTAVPPPGLLQTGGPLDFFVTSIFYPFTLLLVFLGEIVVAPTSLLFRFPPTKT